VSLVVTPRTGNSHEVDGEFQDDHIYLFVCLCVGSPRTRVSVGCGICALMLSADTVSDIIDVFFS
jgi:hypothetical protein